MTEINSNTSAIDSNDDYYEDDFEPDIITENTSERIKNEQQKDDSDEILAQNKLSGVEKGQMEAENQRKEKATEEVSDSEPELDGDGYNFTEDQQRAMMELMVQKEEDRDFLDEEPPEYNVKGRLEQLNAELANEPSPQEGDRELKVGFKPEIVDLVAPPPTFSDDESQPNSARGENKENDLEPSKTEQPIPNSSNENEPDGSKQKTFVVERDGNFEVVGINELTASERALYVNEEEEKDNNNNQNLLIKNNSLSSSSPSPSSSSSSSSLPPSNKNINTNHASCGANPRPPAHPRPNTATNTTRRYVRPTQSPRPKSANHASSSSDNSLDNFNYNSPYAMTPEEKKKGRDLALKNEEERREIEKRRKEEKESKHSENEQAFQAWLMAKKEFDAKRRQEREKNNQEQEDRKEANEVAFKAWLKEKRDQGKVDKLLKRRQQQEIMEGYHVRSRQEAEKAFKEWLKKKNVALRQQHEMERQRNRLYNLSVRRSKKNQALSKAMKESQSFRYVDYYGYRF